MRATNKVTGVTVSLDEKAARRLGPEWESAKSAPTRRPTPTPKRSGKKSDRPDS